MTFPERDGTMPEIQPLADRQEIACAEMRGQPCGMVVFGASGDLAQRKLVGSLYGLYKRQLLPDEFYFLGCGRKQLSDQDYRELTLKSVSKIEQDLDLVQEFLEKIYYISGNYDDSRFYMDIKSRLMELDKKHKVDNTRLFYLSVPPFLYELIVEQLGKAGLSCCDDSEKLPNARLVIEKPFGRDLDSALALDAKIHHCFNESQIYRIDHYLGKETVQNILMFRFANTIFEPVWNRNFVDHIQITIAESIGIEHRGGYYDKSGALRDMFQNHMLQILSLVAMEAPASFEANRIRDEKVKVLQSVRPFALDGDGAKDIIKGQYSAGTVSGKKVCGYLEEEGVSQNSKTETFVAAKLFIDNWRWKDVPFYLRTGKRLGNKSTEIAITFKKVPHSMFASVGLGDLPANVLVLKIQPEEGIELSFQAKRPGSKTCVTTLTMNFSYREVFGTEAPEAYQRLLLDCMLGDQTLFTRQDAVQTAWKLLTPVLQLWQDDGSPLHEYAAGSDSFPQADNLIESDGRQWRRIT